MDWNLTALRKSGNDRVLGGVCGGLGEYTPVPANVWRILFALTMLAGGAGLLVYLLMCWFMPASDGAGSSAGAAWHLDALHRSAMDRQVEGVCGGLGECTPVPSWLWRVAFVATIFAGGIGAVAYLLLWAFIPRASRAIQ